jgi:hypothetical protein
VERDASRVSEVILLLHPRRCSVFSLKRLPILCLIVVLLLAAALPVAAEQPVKWEATETVIGVDIDLCPFPVAVAEHTNSSIIGWAGENGAWIRGHDHVSEQDTFSANGKTLVSLP